MAGDVADDLAPARRVTDVYRVSEVQVSDDGGQVIGVVIHVVPAGDLRRASMTATGVRHHAKAALDEEHHLGIPVVTRQWPSVTEDDRLTAAPVLEEDLYAVVGGDRPHGRSPWLRVCVMPELNVPLQSSGAGRLDPQLRTLVKFFDRHAMRSVLM